MTLSPTILLLDEPGIHLMTRMAILVRAGYHVTCVTSSAELQAGIAAEAPDIAIVAFTPTRSGTRKLAEELRAAVPGICLVGLTVGDPVDPTLCTTTIDVFHGPKALLAGVHSVLQALNDRKNRPNNSQIFNLGA